MTRVLILGAGGDIARRVIDKLAGDDSTHMTLFLRNPGRLGNRTLRNGSIIRGDVLNRDDLLNAMKGIDIVYANLAGDLGKMAGNIVRAMTDGGVKRLIFICSIGIYDTPVKPVLRPYRRAADVIEGSGLDYTILRPTWFTDEDEVDYETTKKGEPERGSVVSRKSVAALVARLIKAPDLFVRESIGVNKPGS